MHIKEIKTQTHEKVLFCTDEESGLRSFIAMHDTTLGPALGGCRMWSYDSADDALDDVLRLSRGMTAKSALAGMPFGGGKAVIIGDARTDKTPELLRAFGRFVDTLEGAFYTGEDVGMSPADMKIAADETDYISGLPSGPFASGDPSPVTAEGVFLSMKIAAEQAFGTPDLTGRRVAIQGLGNVGWHLAERLHESGARLLVADIHGASVARAVTGFGAEVVAPDRIVTSEADIFAPCALGGILEDDTVRQLKAKVVCGSANNQLADDGIAEILHAGGVLYCPDYVVNAGGLINVAREILEIADQVWVDDHLQRAADTFRELLRREQAENRSPLDIADEMVAQILQDAQRPGQTATAV